MQFYVNFLKFLHDCAYRQKYGQAELICIGNLAAIDLPTQLLTGPVEQHLRTERKMRYHSAKPSWYNVGQSR